MVSASGALSTALHSWSTLHSFVNMGRIVSNETLVVILAATSSLTVFKPSTVNLFSVDDIPGIVKASSFINSASVAEDFTIAESDSVVSEISLFATSLAEAT